MFKTVTDKISEFNWEKLIIDNFFVKNRPINLPIQVIDCSD